MRWANKKLCNRLKTNHFNILRFLFHFINNNMNTTRIYYLYLLDWINWHFVCWKSASDVRFAQFSAKWNKNILTVFTSLIKFIASWFYWKAICLLEKTQKWRKFSPLLVKLIFFGYKYISFSCNTKKNRCTHIRSRVVYVFITDF